MSKMKHTLCYMAALVGFAACTQDELTGDTCKGQYPLTLTATVAGRADTRATVEGTWEKDNAIILAIGENKYTYQYGTDNAWTSSTPYFWKEGDDAISVSAYSFGGKATGDYAVQADQNADDGYQSSDLLYAPAVEVAHGEDAELTFYHQTAKVVVNVKNDGYLSGGTNDNVSMTINGLSTSASFTSPTTQTSTIWAGTWSNHSNQKDITPHKAETTSGYAATFEALVIPQTVSAESTLFQFYVGDVGPFRYTVPTEDIAWETGMVYTYNMTLTMNGTVTVDITTGLPDWGTADKEETIQ